MSEKILFVDDEVSILDSMKRQLRKRFDILTAESGKEALAVLETEGPIAVIIADMRMPEMDGVELLTHVKDMYPDTVRLMLTGNADQETAIEAVNKGQIFRFLNKPCSIPLLATSIALALRQYKLITAEKELLDKTLKGSLTVMSELLGIANPLALSSGVRISQNVIAVANKMSLNNLWQLEIAALMSQIGCVTLPTDILEKQYSGIALTQQENESFESHPEVGGKMLENIPRMEKVASIIKKQRWDYNLFDDDSAEDEVNIGAQIIRAAFDYDLCLKQGMAHEKAIRYLQSNPEIYNKDVVSHLNRCRSKLQNTVMVSVTIEEMRTGMVLEENIVAASGTMLAPKGQQITWPILQGLKNFSKHIGVNEPIRVRVQQ